MPTPDYPPNVLIEPTDACNLRCRMCSIWGEGVTIRRAIGFIKRDVWMKALNEIGSWPVRVNLNLTGAGEPLLHREFLDILAYAKQQGNIGIGFLCNATALDPHKAEAIAALQIDWVGFSVDGAQRDIFEHYRKGAILSEVEDNIERLLSLRRAGKPTILLNMVAHAEADLGLFIERWKGKVDTIQVVMKRPIERIHQRRITLTKPCPSPDEQLVMGWTGQVALCCDDGWGDYIIGTFPEERLYDIWHGAPMNRARAAHRALRGDTINVCTRCDSPRFHDFFEVTLEKTHIRVELPYLRGEYGYWEADTDLQPAPSLI